jgi:hypothetical protein
MTLAILSILSSVIGFVFWIWKRTSEINANPEVKLEKSKEETARQIIQGDEKALNSSLDDALGKLRSLQGDRRK